jgi:hypothetical protein
VTAWRNFLITGALSLAVGLLAAFALVVALDPFGRLGLSKSHQIGYSEERPSMVTRARDPQFNSAIFGNSTSMPLMPENLDRLTGLRFVSLSISGTNAPAAMAVLKFFLAQHPDAKVVVFSLMPDVWCEPSYLEQRPFPFWLYSNIGQYLWGLAQDTSVELIKTKFATPEDNRIDGYHTYGGPLAEASYNDLDFVGARLAGATRRTASTNPNNEFPSFDHLTGAIKSSPDVFYLLLWTPRYIKYTPQPDSPADATDRACRTAILKQTSSLANVKILDWSEADRPENSDIANFYDPIHFRRRLAERIEEDIQRVIPAGLKGP